MKYSAARIKRALTGIGTEAALCSTGASGEPVVGRVCDRIFVVSVRIKTTRGSTETTKSHGNIATMMADQVAGNLF
jgi:hypothetical protein